jgi:release factor glutamine methyltransferase
LLLARVLGRGRAWITAHGECTISQAQAQAFEQLCGRRRTGVPIAYLLGSAEFYGREFAVNETVLVPRPETEHLIDEALRFIRSGMHVLDVGTGCGAIACTIAAETRAYVDGTDSSSSAIATAKQNARRLGLAQRCRFYHGDLAEPVRARRYNAVIANLPYVPTPDLPRPPDSVFFEPREALDGGPDGQAHYRKLLPALPALLRGEALILLEAAPPTIFQLAEMVRIALPGFDVSVGNDYAGLARYVRAVSTSGTCEAARVKVSKQRTAK